MNAVMNKVLLLWFIYHNISADEIDIKFIIVLQS